MVLFYSLFVKDGIVSSIPYAVCMLFSFAMAIFADWLIIKRICTVTEVRKLAVVGGMGDICICCGLKFSTGFDFLGYFCAFIIHLPIIVEPLKPI